jgi:cell division protease FtsH
MNGGDERRVPETVLVDVARAMAEIMGEIHQLAGDDEGASLSDRLRDHLGAEPHGLPVTSHEFPPYQLVDIQVAFEAWAESGPSRTMDIVGVAGQHRRFNPLSELLSRGRGLGAGIGPVEYTDVADSPDSTKSCVHFGVFLLSDGEHRAAALVRGEDPHGPMQSAMIEMIAPDPDHGRAVLAELRRLAVERSVLRGQVVALGPGEGHHYGAMRFMRRPHLDRDELVLPEATLAHVERHVIEVATHSERLQRAGQHLKRGVLLYGPPGTGKTHTVRYLLSRLDTVTAFVLSGQALQFIGQACGMARVLQPSIVILEDIDLIAGDRSFGPIGTNPLLFEVLNQIDGLGDDVDVTFLLTTNRVDILERALAERPGRVDAAIEIAAPDESGRRRLFRLYGAPLGIASLDDQELAAAVTATDGRTATYLREVVRRAAIAAAEANPEGDLTVDGDRLAAAAIDLLEDSATLTRSLLGSDDEPGDGTSPFPPPPGAFYAQAGNRMIRMRHRGIVGLGSAEPPPPFAPEQT